MKKKSVEKSLGKKIIYVSIYISLGLVLSFITHFLGGLVMGKLLLPLHFISLLAGILNGPGVGFFVGLINPFLNFLILGMPPFPLFVFMSIELCTYGLVSGLLNKKNIFFDLIVSMLVGRCIYMIFYYFLGYMFAINLSPVSSILLSYVMGIPGIIIQLILIPLLIKKIPHLKSMKYTGN